MIKYLLLFLLASFSVEAQIVNIPDANFKAKLLEASPQNEIAKNQFWQNIKIDVNDDGEIQESELLNVFMLRVDESSISSLEGILFFLNLNYLWVQYNQLTSLNLSGLNSLIGVNCYQNQLSSLDVTNCFSLVNLMCYNNNLTSLNVSGLSNLSALN
ncbi:MAG: T9SS C-terminal target domain-containing protein, partial [Flavobacterium sp.]|nr:T9SS C-terminal target domain-containing protein [Flavobacterium sp.]